MIEKKCTGCDETKPMEAFSKHAKCAGGRNSKCRACKNEQARLYHEEHREERKAKYSWSTRREQWLIKYYGITEAQYQDLLASQGGRCAICHAEPTEERALAVDHCHVSGSIRGLLCYRCNAALGYLADDVGRMQNAVAYLASEPKIARESPVAPPRRRRAAV